MFLSGLFVFGKPSRQTVIRQEVSFFIGDLAGLCAFIERLFLFVPESQHGQQRNKREALSPEMEILNY
jgi:hypothetical protein